MVLQARVYAPDREVGEGRARKHWSVTCDKRGLLRKIFLCPEGLGFDLTIKRSRAPLPPPPPTHMTLFSFPNRYECDYKPIMQRL